MGMPSSYIFHFVLLVNFFDIEDPGGGINQIPAECTISGDVRFVLLSVVKI